MSEGERSSKNKFYLYVIGILVLLLLVMWVWKNVAVGRAGKQFEKERAELAIQREQMEQNMRAEMRERTKKILRLMGIPLGWAVRTEAVAEDYDQIEEYAAWLVKEPQVQRVVMIGPEGNVRISTDRKLQGEPASGVFGDLPQASEITLRENGSGDLDLMVPILGYTGRLGSVIVTISGD